MFSVYFRKKEKNDVGFEMEVAEDFHKENR